MAAESIILNITNGTEISNNSYLPIPIKNPENAYTVYTYTVNNNNMSVNQNSLVPQNDGVAFITVTDTCSGKSDSKFVVINLLPSEHTITMPVGKRCNWNQKHIGVTSIFGEKACTLVAGLDIANFYSTNEAGYTPEDMNSTDYWTTDGKYRWVIPGPGYLKTEYTFTDDSPEGIDSSIKDEYIIQGYLRYIKNEIYHNRPVMINLGPNRENNHSVVAYKYMIEKEISIDGKSTEMNKIKVFDPENSVTPESINDINGRDITLWETFRYNFISDPNNPWKTFWIWSLRASDTN